MAQSLVFFATVLLLVFSTATDTAVCQTFTIVPSNDSPCPEAVCSTLDQLAQNFSVISPEQGFINVTLDLLPGNHTINLPLAVQNLTRFEISGNNASFLINTSQFLFEQTVFVYFSGISFVINSRPPLAFINEASDFVIENCAFESNEFIRTLSTSSVLIVNTTFARSSSTTLQFLRSVNVTIKDSVFVDGNIVDSSRYFGLIWAVESSLTVDNCDFVDNSIFVDSPTSGLIATTVGSERFAIVNSTFRNNNVGIVAAQGTFFESVVISGCMFSNNNILVGNLLSAVSVRGQNVNIADTIFNDNIVPGSIRSTLLISAEHGSIQNCVFENNNSTGLTAEISLLVANSSFVVERNRFTNNINGDFGGLSVIGGSCSMLIFRQNLFTNNSARRGGILDLTIGNCHTVRIEDNNFIDNSVLTSGGAVRYLDSSLSGTSDSFTDLIIVDNVFVNNSALLCGSAIYGSSSLFGSGQTYRMRLNSTVFDSNNGASANTSLVCLRRGNIDITNSNFSRGSDFRGGALQLTNTVTTIANSTFSFNYANTEGGAIYATGSNVDITYSTLENNQAALRGGAISIDGGMLTVTNTSFANNSASGGRGDNILACSSEVVLPDDALFSVRRDPLDSRCFFYNKALSHGSFSSLVFFIVFTALSVVITSVL